MPLILAPAPTGGERIVADKLDSLRRTRRWGMAGGAAGPAPTAVAPPQPVYTLPLDRIATATDLSAVQPGNWRYLLLAGHEPVGAVELRTTAGGDPPQFAGIHYGSVATTSGDAMSAAERLAPKDSDYELRLLEVPALSVLAVWLHDVTGDADYLVPVNPAPTPLHAHRLYGVAEFLQALRTLGRQRGDFDDRPRLRPGLNP